MKSLIIKMGVAHSLQKNDSIGLSEPVREKRKTVTRVKTPAKRKRTAVRKKRVQKGKNKRTSPVKKSKRNNKKK